MVSRDGTERSADITLAASSPHREAVPDPIIEIEMAALPVRVAAKATRRA